MKVDRFSLEDSSSSVDLQEVYRNFLVALCEYERSRQFATLKKFNDIAGITVFEDFGGVIKLNPCGFFTVTHERMSHWEHSLIVTIHNGEYLFVYAGSQDKNSQPIYLGSYFRILERRVDWENFKVIGAENTVAEVQTSESENKSLHPLVLPGGGLGILAGYAKVGKSTLIPRLLEEILTHHPNIAILYFTLDEDESYTLRRLKAYPQLKDFPNLKIIGYETLFSRAKGAGFSFDLILEELEGFASHPLKLVVLDSLGKIREFLLMIDPRTRLQEKEKAFWKVRQGLKAHRTTLLGIHHLTKIADIKLEKLFKSSSFEEVDFASYFLSAVKGSSFLVENADYIAILFPNPASPTTERLLSITGRHIPRSQTLCYQSVFTDGLDFPFMQKREHFDLHPDIEDILHDAENLAFLEAISKNEPISFSKAVEIAAQKLNVPPEKRRAFLKKIWDRSFRISRSLKNLGLIEQDTNKLLRLSDFGKNLLTLYLQEKSDA